jgi:hypothetical protein
MIKHFALAVGVAAALNGFTVAFAAASNPTAPTSIQVADKSDRQSAVNYANRAEAERGNYREYAVGFFDELTLRAVKFDDKSNHSYACSVYANLLYKTAFGDKPDDVKAKIFDSTESNAEHLHCSSPNYGSVKYG